MYYNYFNFLNNKTVSLLMFSSFFLNVLKQYWIKEVLQIFQ